MAIEFVIFDMDGVIFEGRNSWLDLHHRFSTEIEALELAERYMRDDYELLARITAEKLWKDRPAEALFELVRNRTYQNGVVQLCDYLRRTRVKTAIVSSGPKQLAARAQLDLGIDEIRANELVIVNGRISGDVNIEVRDSEKGRVGLELMATSHAAPERTAAIGDTDSDVDLATAVGLAVAYDSVSRELNRVADVRLAKGQLARMIEVISEFES